MRQRFNLSNEDGKKDDDVSAVAKREVVGREIQLNSGCYLVIAMLVVLSVVILIMTIVIYIAVKDIPIPPPSPAPPIASIADNPHMQATMKAVNLFRKRQQVIPST